MMYGKGAQKLWLKYLEGTFLWNVWLNVGASFSYNFGLGAATVRSKGVVQQMPTLDKEES